MKLPYKSTIVDAIFEKLPEEVQRQLIDMKRKMEEPEDLDEAFEGMRLKELGDKEWENIVEEVRNTDPEIAAMMSLVDKLNLPPSSKTLDGLGEGGRAF